MWMWSSACRIANHRGPPQSPRSAIPAPCRSSRAISAHVPSGSTQPPWSVSSPALAAIVACSTPDARAQADAVARRADADRAALVDGLLALGLGVVRTGRAPFVLVDTSTLAATSLRASLAARGFAVRRGDTFPGLGPAWLRVAVRTPEISRSFCAALAAVKEEA